MPGIASNNTSLLTKLGQKAAWEMTNDELLAMVTADQQRRSIQRSLGRLHRMMKDKPSPKPKLTLEQLGLDPSLITRMRASGLSEAVLIKRIQEAGLL